MPSKLLNEKINAKEFMLKFRVFDEVSFFEDEL